LINDLITVTLSSLCLANIKVLFELS